MRSPNHIHVDFIADHRHVVFLTQLRHGGQFFARPDFSAGVLRTAQQHNGVLRLCQRLLKLGEITLPVVMLFTQRNRHHVSLITLNGFVERIVGGSVHHYAVAGGGPLADHLGNHINHGGAVHQLLRIDPAVKPGSVPVRDSRYKVVVFPAAVTQHAVVEPSAQRVKNAGRGGKIHIGNGKRQQIGCAEAVGDVVPLRTPGAVSVHRG